MSFLVESGQCNFYLKIEIINLHISIVFLPRTKSFYTYDLKFYSEKWGYINDLEAPWVPFELLKQGGILFWVN